MDPAPRAQPPTGRGATAPTLRRTVL